MRRFEDFISALDSDTGEDVVATACTLLRRDEDWCGMLADYLERIDDEELAALVFRAHIRWVEPRVFMVFEGSDRYRIILHHFDVERFDRFRREGRVGAHFHHFPFATRILRGEYFNWLFDNAGTLEQPDLSFARQVHCRKDDIYMLPFDRYHCVLQPAADTMSLMVRGKAARQRDHPHEPGYTAADVTRLKARYIELLRASRDRAPGSVLDFQTTAMAE